MVQKRIRKQQDTMDAGSGAKRRKSANSKKKKSLERMAALRGALAAWRSSACAAVSCSEALLCSDALLERIAQARPTTIEELSALGFGNFKASFFGSTVLGIIQQHGVPKPPQCRSPQRSWERIWPNNIDISTIFRQTAVQATPTAALACRSTPSAPTDQSNPTMSQFEAHPQTPLVVGSSPSTPPFGVFQQVKKGQPMEIVDMTIEVEGVSVPVEMACSSGDEVSEHEVRELPNPEGEGLSCVEVAESSMPQVVTIPAPKQARVDGHKGPSGDPSCPALPLSDGEAPASAQKSPRVVWSTTYEVLTRFRSGEQQEAPADRMAEGASNREGMSDGELRPTKTRKRKSLERELPFLPSRDPAPDLDCIKQQNDYYKEMAERLRAQDHVKRMVDSWFEICLKRARASSEKAKAQKSTRAEKRPTAGEGIKLPFWIGACDGEEQPKNQRGLAHKRKPDIAKLQLKALQLFAQEAGVPPENTKNSTAEELRSVCSELVDQWEVNRVLACKPLPDWKRSFAVLRLQGHQTLDTVKAAFRKLTLVVHPDKNKSKGAADAFCLITDSLEWLCSRM